jgi:hypothetical protein
MISKTNRKILDVYFSFILNEEKYCAIIELKVNKTGEIAIAQIFEKKGYTNYFKPGFNHYYLFGINFQSGNLQPIESFKVMKYKYDFNAIDIHVRSSYVEIET